MRDAAIELHRQTLPRTFDGGTPFGVFFLLWAIAAIPCVLVFGWRGWQWIAASGATAVVATAGLLAWLWPIARGQSGRQFRRIQQLLANARHGLRVALEAARDRGQREAQALVANRDEQLIAAEQRVHALVGERESWSEEEIGRAGQTFPQRLAELRDSLDRTLAAAKHKHAEALATVTERRDRRETENRSEYAPGLRVGAEHDRDWQSLADRWRAGLADMNESWERMRASASGYSPIGT